MFDLHQSLSLIRGALLDPDATWRRYLPEAGDWKRTASLLTVPLIVLSAVIAYLIGILGSGASAFGLRPTLVSTLVSMLTSAIAAGVVAFIVGTLAGVFGGRKSFAYGLAATTLAFVPGYVGQALSPLPWIGWIVGLLMFVYALVLLWRIIPVYLEVPEGKRIGHYILSLVGTIVVMFMVAWVLRPLIGPDLSQFQDPAALRSAEDAPSGVGGLFGEAMRQGELLAAAEEDRYEPPADGELDKDQVEDYLRVMRRTREILEEKAARMKTLAERAEEDEQLSMSDMGEMMSGATQMMGMNTVELEVVKSGGGNWAEHQWVRDALRTAYVQKDGSDAVEHNYALYKKYEDELAPFVAR